MSFLHITLATFKERKGRRAGKTLPEFKGVEKTETILSFFQ